MCAHHRAVQYATGGVRRTRPRFGLRANAPCFPPEGCGARKCLRQADVVPGKRAAFRAALPARFLLRRCVVAGLCRLWSNRRCEQVFLFVIGAVDLAQGAKYDSRAGSGQYTTCN